jgi:alpha-aminoadipate carrier protein LysW
LIGRFSVVQQHARNKTFECRHRIWEGIDMAECPECGAEIVEDVAYEEGEIINCEDCGVELEVISEAPLEFALAPEEEEDWGE